MARNKNYVRCIRVMHPLSEVRLYRIVAAFFRLIGVFACENIIGQKYGDETDWEYEIKPGAEGSEESLEQGLYNVLDQMEETFGAEVVEVLRRIADIFFQYDLMRASYAQDYFGDVELRYEYIYQQMEIARDHFEEALKALKETGDQYCDNCGVIYIWAAMSSCKRRTNELYTIVWNAIQSGRYGKDEIEREKLRKKLWEGHYYSLEEINEDILKILEREPQFYGAYTIRGFALEVDDDYKIESVKDIKTAVIIIGEKSYVSYLYYRIGRYCERVRHNLPVKIEYYKKAYEVDEHNYRALCKLAEYEKGMKHYGKAVRMWEDLLSVLEERRDLPSLQPVECAYLYRSFRELGNLYIKLENPLKGIEFLEKAVAVYENHGNEDKQSGFYPWMFGREEVTWEGRSVERWEIYKEAAKSKLQIDGTYVDIINIAARMNDQELYNKYTEKCKMAC